MREQLSFACEGAWLAATADAGDRAVGVLIVSGGTQVRIGAHRGQALLAAGVAAAGFPVIRFDRRGVGDSDGADPGFRGSAADIAAAAATFRERFPNMRQLIGFGLCDGAAALALHHRAAGIDGLLLVNPWVTEAQPGMPPPAAIRRRYVQRLASAAAWRRLLGGEISLVKAARGLQAAITPAPTRLADEVARALANSTAPVRFLLAAEDATALAFRAEYRGRRFAALRASGRAECEVLASSSHSFATPDDAAWLAGAVIAALAKIERP